EAEGDFLANGRKDDLPVRVLENEADAGGNLVRIRTDLQPGRGGPATGRPGQAMHEAQDRAFARAVRSEEPYPPLPEDERQGQYDAAVAVGEIDLLEHDVGVSGGPWARRGGQLIRPGGCR